MFELEFVADMVEEQLVKGNLRWLANFSEIRRDHVLSDVTFPVYASGGLREKGFFLSKIFSTLVTPNYNVRFLLYTGANIDPKLFRKLVLSCKNSFGEDDWVFLVLVQNEQIGQATKEAILDLSNKTIGVAAYTLESKEGITSNNVLGKGLAKQLKVTEASFETFDLASYLKSFTIVLFFGVLVLVTLQLMGVQGAVQPLTLLLLAFFSVLIGHRIYKTRYSMTLSLNSSGFHLREGKEVTERKWTDYNDLTVYVAPNRETYLRLQSKQNTFDLPLSRVGMPRREAYSSIRELIRKKQNL